MQLRSLFGPIALSFLLPRACSRSLRRTRVCRGRRHPAHSAGKHERTSASAPAPAAPPAAAELRDPRHALHAGRERGGDASADSDRLHRRLPRERRRASLPARRHRYQVGKDRAHAGRLPLHGHYPLRRDEQAGSDQGLSVRAQREQQGRRPHRATRGNTAQHSRRRALQGARPALPGQPAPQRCYDENECPLDLVGTAVCPGTHRREESAKRGWGANCKVTSECGNGLECIKETCEEPAKCDDAKDCSGVAASECVDGKCHVPDAEELKGQLGPAKHHWFGLHVGTDFLFMNEGSSICGPDSSGSDAQKFNCFQGGNEYVGTPNRFWPRQDTCLQKVALRCDHSRRGYLSYDYMFGAARPGGGGSKARDRERGGGRTARARPGGGGGAGGGETETGGGPLGASKIGASCHRGATALAGVSVGARLGWAFRGAPKGFSPATSPPHRSACCVQPTQGSPSSRAFGRTFGLAVGHAQVDASGTTTIVDCVSHDPGCVSAKSTADINGYLADPNQALIRKLDAYRSGAPFFFRADAEHHVRVHERGRRRLQPERHVPGHHHRADRGLRGWGFSGEARNGAFSVRGGARSPEGVRPPRRHPGARSRRA